MERESSLFNIKDWFITLDSYTANSITHTRFRAPYLNNDGYKFKLLRKDRFSSIMKLFGMQDIVIGDPKFDEDFIIQSTSKDNVIQMLKIEQVKDIISRFNSPNIVIKEDEGWFKDKFPSGVDELYLEITGVPKDINELQDVFKVFSSILNYVCHIDSLYRKGPHSIIPSREP